MRANENITSSLCALLQDRTNTSPSKERRAGNLEFKTRIRAVGVTPGGNEQCVDDCPWSCSCPSDIREMRRNLEASIGTHKDKFMQLCTSIHELCSELVGLSREHAIKNEPINLRCLLPLQCSFRTFLIFNGRWQRSASPLRDRNMKQWMKQRNSATTNCLRCALPGTLGGMPIVELDRSNPCPQLFMDGDRVMPPSVPPPPRV